DSGVKNIKYSVDGGATQTVAGDNTDVTVPAPADHSNDGVHSIEYWASDNADADWHSSAVSVHLAATDPLAGPALSDSGVKNIKYSVDGGATQTVAGDNTDVTVPAPADHSNDGVHSIEYWATDNAGNAESPHNTATVKIDTGNPSSSDNADADWHSSAVSVHLAATDPLAGPALSDSGVKNIKYSVDGGATQTVAGDNTDVTVPAPA